MKPGVYRGIPNDEYHSGPGISKSGLDLIAKSPAHYRAATTAANDNKPGPTAAQFLGTAFHALVLEPAEFLKNYTLALRRQDVPNAIDDREVLVAMIQKLNLDRKPKLSRTGSKAELVDRIVAEVPGHEDKRADLESFAMKELQIIIDAANMNRAGLLPTSGSRHDLAAILRANGVEVTLWSDVVAEWQQNNGHRNVLTEEQFQQLHNMRDAVMAHPSARKLLAGDGEAELSAYAIDPKTGLLVRVRPDKWRKDGIIPDLKSCEDASPEGFAKSISNYRYYVQHAMYLRVARAALAAELQKGDSEFHDWAAPRAFVFIAVEKTACVVEGQAKGVAVYKLDEESALLGAAEMRRDLDTYAECEASGRWPGYASTVQHIKLPAWKVTHAAQAATV